MDFNDFREYFTTYVKEYEPYKDSGVYKVFIDFLIEKYYNDSYVSIPADFSTAFEKQIFPSNFTVPFLESIGITSDIISQLSTTDRYKVATLLSDFHRYKGTVTLVNKLLATFSEKQAIAVYELYLDKAPTGEWQVLPSMLDKSNLVSTTLNKAMPYSTLEKALHWYIDTKTLDAFEADQEIALPYKTNVLYVDGSIQEDLSLIVNMVSALVQESFKSDTIQLFFKDSSYATSFANFTILWQYILRYVANKGTKTSPFTTHSNFDPTLVFGTYEIPTKTNTLPRGKTNIQTILDLYDSYKANTNTKTINTDIWTLFTTQVNIFNGPLSSPQDNFLQYRVNVLTALGSSLIDYIDNRLSTATVLLDEVHLLLGELYSSMLTFKLVTTSTLNTDYIDYYLLTLSGFSNDLSKGPFFLLLNFLKPLHCDLIVETANNIASHSLFDNGLSSYMTAYSFLLQQVTHQAISDNSDTLSTTRNLFDNQMSASVVGKWTAIQGGLTSSTPVLDSTGNYIYVNNTTGTPVTTTGIL